MRIPDPLIVGAGPAGCAAAITLARAGQSPLLVDRYANPGDALCGGFLSWETAKRLQGLGVDVAQLGAHTVRHLALFAGTRTVRTSLPAPSWGLSRHALDTALKAQALVAGARFETRHVRRYRQHGTDALLDTDTGPISSAHIFLATGKHDLRPLHRPHNPDNPTLGLRVVVEDTAELRALVGDGIELHLFDGGYCGIVVQEAGRVNICMALRKHSLIAAGGSPRALLDHMRGAYPALGARLASIPANARIDAIGSVPYGWRKTAGDSLFRLGDQAAVIPSLAGEGIDIALASGIAAADRLLNQPEQAAPLFQEAFARRTAQPVRIANALWHAAENPRLASVGLRLLSAMPAFTRLAARLTRIS